MAQIKTIQKAQSEGRYLVVYDNSGAEVCVVLTGDPSSIATQIQNIIGSVASFLQLESGDYLLQESGDKIVL